MSKKEDLEEQANKLLEGFDMTELDAITIGCNECVKKPECEAKFHQMFPERARFVHAWGMVLVMLEMAKEAQQIIAAWGNHGGLLNRAEFVRQLIPDLFHLGLTQIEHQPRHPLYLPSSTQPVKWGN